MRKSLHREMPLTFSPQCVRGKCSSVFIAEWPRVSMCYSKVSELTTCNPLWRLIMILFVFLVLLAALFLRSELKVYFLLSLANYKALCVCACVCVRESCIAESFLTLFVDMIRCGRYRVVGDNNTLGIFLSFTCVAVMLRECALKCN